MKNKVAILGLGEHQLQAVKTLKKRFIVFGFDASNNPFSKKYVNKFYNIDFKQRRLIYQICIYIIQNLLKRDTDIDTK